MSESRSQEYQFQHKSISVGRSVQFWGNPSLKMAVPDNLLDLKGVYLHVILQFNTSVPSAKKKVLWIGGMFDKQGSTSTYIPVPNASMINVNKAADVSNIVDLAIDISHLKNFLPTVTGELTQPYIAFSLITDINATLDVTGKVLLWKADLTYTTEGIQ